MKVFDKFKSKNIDELAEWLDKYSNFEYAPWMKWLEDTYCSKCPTEIGRFVDSDRDVNFCWCELHNKCRFFSDMDSIPDSKQVIKMWLESEIEE